MRISLSEYCQRNQREDLLAEWDSARNAPLTPDSVSYGSKRKVWWTCAHGHHWQAAVHTRTGSGTGCPYCSGRLPLPGVNDLATTYPDLARQWHPTKNAPLTPADVLPGSHLQPQQRQRLPSLRRQKDHPRRKRSRQPISRHRTPMAPNQKRRPHPRPHRPRQQQESLVDLRQRPRVSGCRFQPYPAQRRMSILRQHQSAPRV